MKKTDLNRIEYPKGISGSDKAFVRRIINHVRDFINKNNLTKLAIACSAGLDSTCLADICHKVSIINGTKFCAIYVNHGLRPDENDKEIELISKLPISYLIADGLVQHGTNLEARARDIRYSKFALVCSQMQYNSIFVAHNADEDLETMIMRIADNRYNRIESKNSFQRVVYGIKPHSIINGLNVYRPLLSFTKDDLRRYNKIMGVAWLEDSSNSSLQFERNVIRHKVMPTLKNIRANKAVCA